MMKRLLLVALATAWCAGISAQKVLNNDKTNADEQVVDTCYDERDVYLGMGMDSLYHDLLIIQTESDRGEMMSSASNFTQAMEYFANHFNGENNKLNRALLLVMNDLIVELARECRNINTKIPVDTYRTIACTIIKEMQQKATVAGGMSQPISGLFQSINLSLSTSHNEEVIKSIQMYATEYEAVKDKKERKDILNKLIETMENAALKNYLTTQDALHIKFFLVHDLLPQLSKQEQKELRLGINEMIEIVSLSTFN